MALAIPKQVSAIVKTDTPAINVKHRPTFVKILIVVRMVIVIQQQVSAIVKTDIPANVAKPHPINVN